MMKTLAIILLTVVVYLCHGETSASDDEVGEMPLRYFRSSGLENAMRNETLFTDMFMESYSISGVNTDVPIHTDDGRQVGSTPIEEVERSELAATLDHAGCDIYDQVVTITNDKPNVLLYPSCVQLKRCGGCCGHSSLACKPTQTVPKTVQVLKYVYDGKSANPVKEVSYVQMEDHVSCECQCKLTAAECTPALHYFDNWDCKCMCKNGREQCASDKRWDENLCACRCASVHNCGSGFTYNMETCACEEATERSGGGQPSVVSATTAPPVTSDPCATLSCPRRYKGVLSPGGMCFCEFIRP